MLYDTHAHLNDEAFAADFDAVLARARDAGVVKLNVVGCDEASSRQAVAMAERYEEIYAVVGVHPDDGLHYNDGVEEQLRCWAAQKKVVAFGEIGLDYHYEDNTPHDVQRRVFRRQLRLAKEVKLPVVIHCRDAMEDVLAILAEEEQGEGFRAVFHCFSGSWEQAQICLNRGYYLGFDGPLTFKNSKKLPRVASLMPLERILIETDCPYMSPEPVRGRRNEPAHVAHIAAKLGEIRGISTAEAEQRTYENACRLFLSN